MSQFWGAFLFCLIGAIVFLILSFLFHRLQETGNQADPEAYEKLINGTAAIAGLFILGLAITIIAGIVSLFL